MPRKHYNINTHIMLLYKIQKGLEAWNVPKPAQTGMVSITELIASTRVWKVWGSWRAIIHSSLLKLCLQNLQIALPNRFSIFTITVRCHYFGTAKIDKVPWYSINPSPPHGQSITYNRMPKFVRILLIYNLHKHLPHMTTDFRVIAKKDSWLTFFTIKKLMNIALTWLASM